MQTKNFEFWTKNIARQTISKVKLLAIVLSHFGEPKNEFGEAQIRETTYLRYNQADTKFDRNLTWKFLQVSEIYRTNLLPLGFSLNS